MLCIAKLVLALHLTLLITACGDISNNEPSQQGFKPDDSAVDATDAAGHVTIYFLRQNEDYEGWGLHLWGSAIHGNTITKWQSARSYDRIENGAAVFEVPVANLQGSLNFITHRGDFKSPAANLSIIPTEFGHEVWVAEGRVAKLKTRYRGIPFSNEADARAALTRSANSLY